MSGYRDRIYRNYLFGRHQSLAPASIEGLKPRAAYLKKLIRDHFPSQKDARILDLGCGHGALMHFARIAGYQNIVGFDHSPQQVAEARRLGIAGVHEGDLLDSLQALKHDSIDVVVAFDVLEHFTKEEVVQFLDEVHRVLRSGGRWIIHTCNGETPFVGHSRYNDFTHELAFGRVSITQLLKSSGFSQVSCHEDAPVVHGLKSAIRWGLWKLIRVILQIYLVVETGAWEGDRIFTQNFITVAVK